MYEPIVVTGPDIEPITLQELQAQSRIDTTTDEQDELVTRIFIPAARDYIEWRTGRTFYEKTLEWVLDCFPDCGEIVLPCATPLIAIESIVYKNQSGTPTTWDPANYVIDTKSKVGRIVPAYGQWWPSFAPYPINAVSIIGQAGIQVADGAPIQEVSASVKYAMNLLVAKMWEYREAIAVADRVSIAQVSISYGLETYIDRLQASYAF